MDRAESEVSYVTARETQDEERPVVPVISVPVVLEPVVQVPEGGRAVDTAATTTTTTTTTATTAPITPIKTAPGTGLARNVSRTRSGSGTRWSPGVGGGGQTQGQEKTQGGGGIARRGSLAEGGASLTKWWNSFTNPGVGDDHAVAEVGEGDTGLKRETSRSREGVAAAGGTGTGIANNAVFGERLEMSLIYAAVPISTARHDGSGLGEGAGESYVWGYVPVVVAKW